MYFRKNRDRIAFDTTMVENLISALRSRSQMEAFTLATAITDRAVNGPQSTSIRFRNILYWPLDGVLRRRLGKLADDLAAITVDMNENPESLPTVPDMDKLGVPWALILELVMMIIEILKEIREKRQATEEPESEPTA
jgi:hypothetical protein